MGLRNQPLGVLCVQKGAGGYPIGLKPDHKLNGGIGRVTAAAQGGECTRRKLGFVHHILNGYLGRA